MNGNPGEGSVLKIASVLQKWRRWSIENIIENIIETVGKSVRNTNLEEGADRNRK